MSQGAILYFMGFGQAEMVEAEYRLTDEPILVLVDDSAGRLDWPPAKRYVVNELAQELIKSGAANKIIPIETLNQIQRDHSDFSKLSCQKIGELAGAEQVLWLEIQEYFGNQEFFEPTNAAYIAANIKVINVLEKESRSRVRLWPSAPRGKFITVSLDASAVARAKTRDIIARGLAVKLADTVAKLFYDYRPDDFEADRW